MLVMIWVYNSSHWFCHHFKNNGFISEYFKQVGKTLVERSVNRELIGARIFKTLTEILSYSLEL
jgi:hypothetical protein